MDKFPLLWKERAVGELTAEREALYTCFSARCTLPAEGLWCAWVVGDKGELRLGVLEPQGGAGVICRRFSHRMTAPAGQLLEQRAVPFAPGPFRGVHRHNAGADLARDDDCVLWKQLRRCRFLRARKRLKVVIAAFSGLETLRQIAERVRRKAELFHCPRQLSLIRAADDQLHT